jgi:hypothetical protein
MRGLSAAIAAHDQFFAPDSSKDCPLAVACLVANLGDAGIAPLTHVYCPGTIDEFAPVATCTAALEFATRLASHVWPELCENESWTVFGDDFGMDSAAICAGSGTNFEGLAPLRSFTVGPPMVARGGSSPR